MTFLKYHGETSGNGRGPIHWNRSDRDGAPFRGQAPLLRDEEYEQLAERVWDTKVGTFNTANPTQTQPAGDPLGLTLQQILDRKKNGWFEVLDYKTEWGRDADGNPVMFVFVVWSEAYQELPHKYNNGRLQQSQGSGHEANIPLGDGPPPIM